MAKTIYLINGLKRAGKDYTGDLIQAKLEKDGIRSERLAFASPMKNILSHTLGTSEEGLDILKNNEHTKIGSDDFIIYTNMRKILQNFGQSAKAHFGKNVWAQLALAKAISSPAEHIIISDFRYLEEYSYIKENISEDDKVITIQVLKDEPNTDTHCSEQTPSIVFDYVIDNSMKDNTVQEWVDTHINKGN